MRQAPPRRPSTGAPTRPACTSPEPSRCHPAAIVDFANGRTRFVRIPDDGDRALRITGRPLAWYSYFFHATGDTRRRLLDAVEQVRLREPYRVLGSAIAADLGAYNVAHVRRTDLVRGIRAYAGVSPDPDRARPRHDPAHRRAAPDRHRGRPVQQPVRPLPGPLPHVAFLTDVILGDHAAGFDGLPFREDNALGGGHPGGRGAGSTASSARWAARSPDSSIASGAARDPSEPFCFTADYTPEGPVFRDGRYVEVHDGRYTWNRVGLQVSPDVPVLDPRVARGGALARRRPGAGARSAATGTGAEPIHAVVCTDTNPYGDWQCRFQEHTWARVGQPGELVRLVACPEGEPDPPPRPAPGWSRPRRPTATRGRPRSTGASTACGRCRSGSASSTPGHDPDPRQRLRVPGHRAHHGRAGRDRRPGVVRVR